MEAIFTFALLLGAMGWAVMKPNSKVGRFLNALASEDDCVTMGTTENETESINELPYDQAA